jgi:hypothetical protein
MSVEQQVHIQSDLDDVPNAATLARQHVSERGFHSTTQAHRHIAWQRAAKTSAIEVHIEASKIFALFGGRAAVGRVRSTTIINRPSPLIMLCA